MASGAVPVTLIVLILPVPLTASTFTIASLAGLAPPMLLPNIFNLSPAAYPDVASAAVPDELNDAVSYTHLTLPTKLAV